MKTTPTVKEETTLDYRNSVAVVSVLKQQTEIEARLASLVVNSENSVKLCTETGVIIARLEKELEAERKRYVDPLNAQVKVCNTFFKQYTDKLSALKELAAKKIREYRAELERKRQEEQRRLNAIMEEQRRKELEEAAKNNIAPPPVALTVPIAAPVNTTHSDTGSASGRRVWKWKVEDLAKVPKEYFVLDEKKINALVKGGVRQIAGIIIYEETDITFRT